MQKLVKQRPIKNSLISSHIVLFGIFLLCSLIIVNSSPAQVNKQEQNKLQAVYMYNFLKFIDWPQESTLVSSQNYQICIIGDNPFGTSLDVLKTKKINNKNIYVNYLTMQQSISHCHLVFLSNADSLNYSNLLKQPEYNGILTVSTDKNFARQGGIIAFIVHNNRVRFNINRTMALKRGLHINSKLLELAISIF